MHRLTFILPLLFLLPRPGFCARTFKHDVKPLLTKYCVSCHSGNDANADINFEVIQTTRQVEKAFETWKAAVEHLRNGTMPPPDEPQPSDKDRGVMIAWYKDFVESVEEKPGVFRPRRLSVNEYRNTLRSVFGFDLEVAVIEAEQTRSERSLVVKLLPTDPPGKSGFKNDTHENPLTSVVWDQYGFLTRSALDQLFSDSHREQLEEIIGPLPGGRLSTTQAQKLVETFIFRTQRRPASTEQEKILQRRLNGLTKDDLQAAVRLELEAMLMSPRFIYRGLMMNGKAGQRQAVDSFELAERLSYFVWADMPDEHLMSLAQDRQLKSEAVIHSEVDRMLASSKARSLAELFATEWLTINEIEHVTKELPQMLAMKSQPLDFMMYLFTQDRPLLELIDSDVTFINPHTRRMYGSDAKQMERYVKQRGIEVEAVPNQMVTLETTVERGGILTMPGILAMNRGPILRGTWMLEKILGQPLPEPPPDVGQVKPNRDGKELTFRQRFEQHRSKPTCAVCHDKIDPLGFALQEFGSDGQYLRSVNYRRPKKEKRGSDTSGADSEIDTAGKLPTGESFAGIMELKKILTTSQRDVVIRNIVERTMSYALCRKLTIYDQPAVTAITQRMSESNGTWRQLFHAITDSVPFRETLMPNTTDTANHSRQPQQSERTR